MQALGVDCNMPMAESRDLQPHRRLPHYATGINVFDPFFVICKIEIVHEPHIRGLGQRHFDYFANLSGA